VVTFYIADGCIDVKDRSCTEVCPVDCIYEGDRMLYIHPDECVDCGACEPVCPMDAIFSDLLATDPGARFITYSQELFGELGPLGGAVDHGPLGRDHAAVANL
jgi:ferredoxin